MRFTEEEMWGILEQSTKEVLYTKGMDIDTEEGLTKSAEFLKTATWNDTFFSENPPDNYPEVFNEIDMLAGTIRLEMMRDVIEARMKGA